MNSLVEDVNAIDPTDVMHLLELADASPRSVDIIDKLLWFRLLSMRRRLSEALSMRETDSALGATYRIYNALSPTHQARILVSSELCESLIYLSTSYAHRLTTINKDEVENDIALIHAKLLDIVCREQAIVDIENGRHNYFLSSHKTRTFFSPLGDKRAVANATGVWSVQKMPSIGGIVSIDFDSPLAVAHEPRSGVLSQRCLPLSDDEKAAVVTKLQSALENIDATVPTYGLIVRNFVRRIIVRKSYDVSEGESGAERSRFGSEHVPRQPGSIRLLNTHLESMSVESCMETLMHESTHNYLAAWEFSNDMFVLNDPRNRVTSPWSGNQIPNSSFIHAIFVYYICHRLLRAYMENLEDDGERARKHLQERLANFMSGFLIRQDLPELILTEHEIDPTLSFVLRQMQTSMKQIHNRDIYEAVA
ncbi:hypothetical protein [Dyella flagellata]|uniref:HEXXH motif-containing protein n=1 Tax=Dyella flagellata TaxID=1867833 RepID=A0ABQ5XET7_9GAMM|nr:hypothetical protein [Dyella flagellata]GLQ89166.1 hypothetical protein GCM10007898_27380 [Dyella flagellata]